MADYNITAVTRRVVYTGSAGVGPYAFTFPVISQTDIAVYQNSTKLTLTTNYTVTVSSANGTGSVTLVVAATGSDRITIIGARAIERTTDFVTAGDLKASSLNEQLDASIILIQQLAEENKRTLKAPQFDPAAVEDGGTLSMVLPVSTSRAGKLLAFDTDGNPVVGEDIGNWRGNWAASVAFVVRDLVKDGSNSNVYRVNTAHTSSGTTPISSNADVAKFDLVVDAAASAASAAAAAASASAASSSASAASSSASAASTSASNASTSATNASTSASNSSTSASAAAASAAAAAASFDAFDDIYLGAYSTNPTLDNDGNSLTTGDQYFNTTANELRVWNGSSWQAASTVGGTIATLNVTGVASFADGSAALPSITNDGDTNTGIFFPAADTIAISTGGTERTRVSSAGVALNGSTSGSATLAAPAVAGTTTLTLPAVTGTISLAAYTMQVFTSGSGTYTTPTGCKAILIELVGAGGGAGGGQVTYNIAGAPGTAGGNTTFSTLTGGGGPGGTVSAVNPGGGTASGGDVNIPGGSGGCSVLQTAGTQGNSGGNSFFGGGGGTGGDGQPGGTPGTNSGSGGASSSTSVASRVAGGGGSAGGYVRDLIANPSATYSYAVGAGGAAGNYVAPFGASSAGAAGIIIVTEYY